MDLALRGKVQRPRSAKYYFSSVISESNKGGLPLADRTAFRSCSQAMSSLISLTLHAHLFGLKITGMTDYMFNAKIPWFTLAISLFHGWLPFLLLYLVARLWYDRRALRLWIALNTALVLICYFWMPPASAQLPNPKQPRNINYVHGFSDDVPQPWMPSCSWLLVMLIGQPVLFASPTHAVLIRQWGCRGGESNASD